GDAVRARAPAPQEHPADEHDVIDSPLLYDERHPDQGDERADGTRAGFLRRHPFSVALGLVVCAGAAAGGYLYWDNARHFESTDDSFIAARPSALAPKVAGYITAVPVTDNQHAATGDVVARIDDRDYRIALEQAEAQVAAAQAGIQNIDAQLQVQQAQIATNDAQLQQQQAALVFAQQQAARYKWLADHDSGSVQNAQQYVSQLHQQEASVASAPATLTLSQRQIEALQAQRNNAVASLEQAKAQRDQAQRKLTNTIEAAAQPGAAAT